MTVKGFPGSTKVKGMTGMHFKIGGGMSKTRSGQLAGLPPKAANPFKTGRMITNRAIGLAKMAGKGIY